MHLNSVDIFFHSDTQIRFAKKDHCMYFMVFIHSVPDCIVKSAPLAFASLTTL